VARDRRRLVDPGLALRRRRQCPAGHRRRHRLVGALFGLAALSAFWSVHPERSLAAAVVAIVVLLGAYAVTTVLGWTTTCRLLSAALLVVTAGGLLLDAVFEGLIASLPAVLTGERRFSGLTFSPTDLGRIAAFGVVVSAIAASNTAGRMRVLHVGAVAVAVLALLTSGTRLVVFVLLVVGAVAAVRRRTPASIVVAVVVAAALLTVLAFPSDLAQSVARPGEPTAHVLQFAGRTPIWSAALDVAADRPLLGSGWGSNEVVFREAFIADIIDFEAFTAHNLVVGVLVDLGVVGVTLLLLALVALWHRTRTTPNPGSCCCWCC
jgi:exopolysaccharide production protein ExoQ